MLLISDIKLPLDTDFKNLSSAINIRGVKIKTAKLYRKSVDARHKNDIHFCCSVLITTDNDEVAAKKIKNAKFYTEKPYRYLKTDAKPECRPVVVGFGPAGIFAALTLAKAGLCPIVLERGEDIDSRRRTVKDFWDGKGLCPHSNVQFGEGGAGTFSDGKLTTGIKDIRCREVLRVFKENGAEQDILTDAKPHIGTDVLAVVIKNIREEIIRLGGEIRFQSQMTAMNFAENRLCSIEVSNEEGAYMLPVQKLILAIGHSARDTFYMLRDCGFSMIKKPFAVGVRIEHPQSFINQALYGDFARHPSLAAADYKLAVHLKNGRGVYTFCMCPGGFVVNASSEENRLTVNGMSNKARDGENANSALLTEVLPDDLDADVLSGIEFQRKIEERAYLLGEGSVPVSTVGDYLDGTKSEPLCSPTVKPNFKFTDISLVFPNFINENLREGLKLLDYRLSGFANNGAILSAPETRSSSPVRIMRGENMESVTFSGVYPSGEGAGYAGGIMSAAVDGIKSAESLINSL